jgi:glycosyltransferase involved in cell wall biosynthesis
MAQRSKKFTQFVLRAAGVRNFAATIHHGLPANLHEASYRPTGGYLAFVGRISPEKGPVDAIRIAQSLARHFSLELKARLNRKAHNHSGPCRRSILPPSR